MSREREITEEGLSGKLVSKRWSIEQRQLIEAIKKNKILYQPYTVWDHKASSDRTAAWNQMEAELCIPAKILRMRWDNLKKSYRAALMNPRKPSKYLDGYLDFLKPWAMMAPKRSKNIDKTSNVSNLNVDEQNSMEIVDDFTPKIKTGPTSILLCQEIPDSDSDASMSPSVENDLDTNENPENYIETTEPLTSSRTQYAVKIEDEMLANSNVNNATSNISYQSILKNSPMKVKDEMCEMSQNEERNYNSDLLSDFLNKYDENSDENDLKGYFKDLAEVLCCKLAQTNRTHFLSKIDIIVSQILDDAKGETSDTDY